MGNRPNVRVAEIFTSLNTRYVAVLLPRSDREAALDGIREWRVDCNEKVRQAVGTRSSPNGAAELVAGIDRGEQYRTTDAVFTEQRALRPSQYLYVADVPEVHRAAYGLTDIYVIDVKSDAGVDSRRWIRLADATNENVRRVIVASESRCIGEFKVRRYLAEFVRAEYHSIAKSLGGKGCNGYWRILHAFFVAPGRDYDLVKFASRRGISLSQGLFTAAERTRESYDRCNANKRSGFHGLDPPD
jgi:hypothetical protein